MFKSLFLILFSLQCLGLAQAQTTQPFALIRKIKGLETLPLQIRQRMERVGLQVVLKQQGYQVLISADDLPSSSVVDIVAVDSVISQEGNRYIIETRLLDIKNKKMVRRAVVRNVKEEDLLRLFQASVEAVFKAKAEIEEETPETTKDKEKKTPPPLPAVSINKANSQAIDFKERINAMKNDIDNQFKAVAQDKKNDEDSESSESEKKNPNKSKSPSSSLSGMVNKAQLPKKENPSSKYKSKSSYQVMAGLDKRTVTSAYLVSTKTNTEMLSLKLNSHNTTKFFSERLAWSYNLGVSKLLSGKIEIPTLYQVGLYSTWMDNWGTLSLGLMRDKSFIANLETPGEGIKVTGLDSDWFIMKTEIKLPFLANTIFHAAYGTPLLVTAQIDQLQSWSGSYSALGIIPPRLVGNWDFNIILESISLTNQGVVPFTSEDSRISLLVQRSF